MLHQLKLFLTVFYLFIAGACSTLAADNVCSPQQLPEPVRAILESQFPNWRYATLSDLNDYYRNKWTESSPTECPGVVIGHLHSARSFSYAFLLVPRQGKAEKYKLIVVRRSGENGYVVDEVVTYEAPYHNSVISKAPPREYTDQEKGTKISLLLDGIIVEELGAGASLYYWHQAKYKEILISE